MNAGKYLFALYKYVPTNAARNYAVKSELKIKWNRPEHIPCYKPEKSGDLQPKPTIDLSQYQLEYRQSKELETANDLVKRLFTLEFAPRYKSSSVYIRELINGVQRHHLDLGSIEARIARWTGAIRGMQEVMDNFPRNKRLKVKLKELIDKRKKHLKYLRRWDYKKFEWLIEHLDVAYKPEPSEYERVTRKGSMRKLTKLYCDDIVNTKLNILKLKFQEEQPAFLQEKIRTLEFIRNEQKECGAEVTVHQDDIDKVKEQLESLVKLKEEDVSKDE